MRRALLGACILWGTVAFGQASGRVRVQPPTTVTTPGPDRTTESAADIATANRWCKTMGLEWLCGRGDIIRKWLVAATAKPGLDPATYVCNLGFDSPAVNQTYTFDFTIDPESPMVEINRNGIAYYLPYSAICDATGKCHATLTIPCINEKMPTTFHPAMAHGVIVEGSVCP